MTTIRLEVTADDLAAQIEQMPDPDQAEIVEEILCRLGAHAYQKAADYLRDNPAETERCPRCWTTTFRGGAKGTICHKCKSHWSPT